jgi:hypothetical protein
MAKTFSAEEFCGSHMSNLPICGVFINPPLESAEDESVALSQEDIELVVQKVVQKDIGQPVTFVLFTTEAKQQEHKQMLYTLGMCERVDLHFWVKSTVIAGTNEIVQPEDNHKCVQQFLLGFRGIRESWQMNYESPYAHSDFHIVNSVSSSVGSFAKHERQLPIQLLNEIIQSYMKSPNKDAVILDAFCGARASGAVAGLRMGMKVALFDSSIPNMEAAKLRIFKDVPISEMETKETKPSAKTIYCLPEHMIHTQPDLKKTPPMLQIEAAPNKRKLLTPQVTLLFMQLPMSVWDRLFYLFYTYYKLDHIFLPRTMVL